MADLADILVRIPMAGQVESLNAAVAASVLAFEAARQRRMI
jgi:TrmH family RNA methyltransferase